jgi:hypothetical protein
VTVATPSRRARAGRWGARLAVAALFLTATAVLLGPSLAGGRVALPHDLHLQRLPWAALPAAEAPVANHELGDLIDTYYPTQHAIVDRLLGEGDASWLADVGFGFPGWEFVGWGAVSPFTLAPALVAPFDLAWSWGQGLRLVAAMAGAYLLARSLGAGRPGGAAAGLAFGLSAFVVGWLGWPQSHVAAAMPWVWWAVERTAGCAARWWGAAALAVATAALWLGGFPALSVYALLGAGIVAVAAAARADRPWRRLAAAAAGVGAGTLTAAFTLVPSAALLGEMDLSARADAWTAQAFPIALWTFVAPRVFGGAGGIGPDVPHWIGQASVESTAYVGVVTLALAAAAWALAPRRRGVALHTAMAFGFAGLAYGVAPLVALARLVPPLATNPPNRALALVCLSTAVVGGLGVEAVRRALAGRAKLAPWGLAGAVAVSGAFAAWGGERVAVGALAQFARRYLDDPAQRALARDWAVTSLAVAAGLVATAALIVAIGWWWRRRRLARGRPVAAVGAAAAAALALLVGVDVTMHAVGWNTQVPRQGLFPDAPGLARLRAADGRVAGTGPAGHPNTHLEYGFADLRARGFLTAAQRRALRRAGARFASPTHWTFDGTARGSWEPWLSVLGVHAMLTPAAQDGALPPGWRRRRHGPVDVLANPHARAPVAALTDVTVTDAPLEHVADRQPGEAAAQAALPRGALAPAAVPGGGAAEVTVIRRAGGRVTARVRSEAGAVVALDQAALDGWHARVDDEPAEVVAVDGLFAGVVVGPGGHDVTLAYASPGRDLGRGLTGAGVVGLIAVGALGWWRRPDAGR